jgi:hypothetical protein
MSSNIPENFDKYNPLNIRVMKVEGDPKNTRYLAFGGKILNSSDLTKFIFYSKLLEKIENFLSPFEKFLSTEEILEALRALKKLFEALEKENLSENLEFAEALSTNWHKILDYVSNDIKKNQAQKSCSFRDLLKNFVMLIHSYPANSDQTLGLYLTENLGENWIPFPFMNILFSLFEEYVLKEKKSTLHLWIQKIEELEIAPN